MQKNAAVSGPLFVYHNCQQAGSKLQEELIEYFLSNLGQQEPQQKQGNSPG